MEAVFEGLIGYELCLPLLDVIAHIIATQASMTIQFDAEMLSANFLKICVDIKQQSQPHRFTTESYVLYADLIIRT